MVLSDPSIRRPVLATVLSAVLMIFGLFAFERLTVREYPDIDRPVISIGTTYRGASAPIIETQVTQVVEDAIAGIAGIDTITSASREESSSVNIEFESARDIEGAANDVRDRIARAVGRLPDEAEQPRVAKSDSDARPMIWIAVTSENMNGLALTDYSERFLVDRFSAVPGVARVMVGGGRRTAMRIWLDPEAMAARRLFESLPREFAPAEDRGVAFIPISAPEGPSLEYTKRYVIEIEEALRPLVERGGAARVFTILAPGFGRPGAVNAAFSIVRLRDWAEREVSQSDIVAEIAPKLMAVPGVRAFAITPPGLGQRFSSAPVEMVLGGPSYDVLAQWRDRIMAKAREAPGLTNVRSDYEETRPEVKVEIDRDAGRDLRRAGAAFEPGARHRSRWRARSSGWIGCVRSLSRPAWRRARPLAVRSPRSTAWPRSSSRRRPVSATPGRRVSTSARTPRYS